MKRFITGCVLVGLFAGFSACKKDTTKPEDAFIRIYDDQDGNTHFHPLSITQAADGEGFLIVSAFDGWRIQLMKTDKEGNFQWNYELPENYVNAVPGIIRKDGVNYMVCMDAVGLTSYLLKIDEDAHNTVEIANFADVIYPTFLYQSGTQVYLQNYDRSSYRTELHRLTDDLTGVAQSASVPIYTDVEDRIVNHITYIGKRIPFSVSITPEDDYIVMTGFYNYSFSFIFLTENLSFAGVYNGAGFNGGPAAVSPISNNRFAIARYSFDNLYFNAGATLSPTTIDIAESIPAQGQSELDANKPVIIEDVTVNGTAYKAYLSSTRSNQLLLSLYDTASGTVKRKKYIGKNIPLTATDLLQTADGGLTILTQARIMGSVDRIALIKLSESQLKEIAK